MADVQLTGEEIIRLLMLATLADVDPKSTDPELMAMHYKAKSVIKAEGKCMTFKGKLSVRGE